MADMTRAIAPKSDQLNADDLISGPRTVRITDVVDSGGNEQPISIRFEGDNGKPYKPCKSMSRALVFVWGPESDVYIGRSMTLYFDPDVTWGGEKVGGIRISHMSNIAQAEEFPLTATRGRKIRWRVEPLAVKASVEDHVAGYERAVAATGDLSALMDLVGSDGARKLRAALEKGGKAELLERMKIAERDRNEAFNDAEPDAGEEAALDDDNLDFESGETDDSGDTFDDFEDRERVE